MNPNENNPSSPTGASGAVGGAAPSASGIPSPVDFTNPSALNTNTSSLSMADSLASAQDNLTSAGQAANTGASTAVGLGQLGANDPSASMERPMETLKPADPVPGSIGSVTSVPPLAQPTTGDANFGSATGSASVANAAMTGMSTTTTSATTGVAAPASSAAPLTAGTGTAATTSAKPVQPYYNPFARTNMGASATTSSTNVPPALQPQVSKFSDKFSGTGEKKKGNLMMLLGWLLAALFAVAAVVFAILWIGAKDNERIIYRDPPVSQQPVTDTVAVMNCTQDLGEASIEGLANLTNTRREIAARFVNDQLDKLDFANVYTFTDDVAAEAARGYFDGQNVWYGEIANALGIEAIATGLNIEGNTARYDLSVTAANLAGDYIGVFALTPNAEGTVDKSLTSIEQAYTGAGFICATE